jgi:hypothetical protein
MVPRERLHCGAANYKSAQLQVLLDAAETKSEDYAVEPGINFAQPTDRLKKSR